MHNAKIIPLVQQSFIISLLLCHADLARQVWDSYLHRPPVAPAGWIAPKGFGGWPFVQMQAFSDYVGEFWFGEMPLPWWNHWRNETDRTTNAAEAFHSILIRFVAILFLLTT